MSTTTSYSNNFQLKLIGTGREAGTWGSSMNENLKRIESAMGKLVEIDVEDMPSGSTSANSGNSYVATWLTIDSADDGESGSEGRCRFVEVKDSGGLGANVPSLKIAGSAATEVPARLLYIKNSLSANALTVTCDGASSTVSIPNNTSALVMVVPDATTDHAIGVHNLLDKIQAGEIDFESNGVISFSSGTNSIGIPNGSAQSLRILDATGGVTYLTFDTVDDLLEIGSDVSTALKATFVWTIKNSDTNAFSLTESGGTSVINVDTTNGEIDINRDVVLGTSATEIDSTSNSQSWSMKDNVTDALAFDAGASGVEMLRFDTTDSDEEIHVGVKMNAPDIRINGTDGYLNFNTTVGSGGYGIRDNSGALEMRNSGGAWEALGSILQSVADSAATANGTGGENRKGEFDIGPFRVIFDTIEVPIGLTPTTINPNVNSEVYAVYACVGENLGIARFAPAAWVSDFNSTPEVSFYNPNDGAVKVTYFVIGDSDF